MRAGFPAIRSRGAGLKAPGASNSWKVKLLAHLMRMDVITSQKLKVKLLTRTWKTEQSFRRQVLTSWKTKSCAVKEKKIIEYVLHGSTVEAIWHDHS